MRELKITKQITERSTKSIELYLKEVSKETMITAEEEVDLAKRIKNGDQIALERLVRANLRFVISVAKQYQHHGLSFEDLINEGNLGLIKAAERFDETRGFKFISYAVWWIRQSILKALDDKRRKIRLPANCEKMAREIANAAMKLEQENERVATEREIAELLDMNPEDVKDMLTVSQKELSIDAPVSDDDETAERSRFLEDDSMEAPSDNLLRESLRKEIESALSSLNETEAEVIRLSFGFDTDYPATMDDIGRKFGISSNRVRQIRTKALNKLQKSNNLQSLQGYL